MTVVPLDVKIQQQQQAGMEKTECKALEIANSSHFPLRFICLLLLKSACRISQKDLLSGSIC